jgi:hypothetical protein
MAEVQHSRKVRGQNQDLWDRIWKNKHGEVIIWQNPNIPLIAWMILTLLSIFTVGEFSNITWYLALITLLLWCGLEVFKGVNYFRRCLGVIVLLIIVAAIFKVGY